MASKKLKPFNPLQIIGRGGLCTSSDINRVEALIHAWSADFIQAILVQFAPAPATPVNPPGSSPRAYSFRLGPNTYISTSGTEEWMDQIQLDLTGFTRPTITVAVACDISSASGTATWRARLGGGDNTVDGTVVGTLTGSAVGFSVATSTLTLANPGGKPKLKFTLQSGGAASEAVVTSTSVTVN